MHRFLCLCLLALLCGAPAVAVETCDAPAMLSEDAIARRMGPAVLYPMDVAAYEATVRCYFSLYVLKDRSLASLSWSVTNALLKVMAADPDRFFRILPTIDPEAVRQWHRRLAPASMWPRGTCPTPDHIQIARFAALAPKMAGPPDIQRKALLAELNKLQCHVPQ